MLFWIGIMLSRLFVIIVLSTALCNAAFAQQKRALTLDAAIERALANNPRLTAAERDVGMAVGKRLQTRVLPNPELSLELDNALGSGAYQDTDSAEITVQLSQLIELPGKRAARMEVGDAELESVRWQRNAARLQLISETALAFINVLGAQGKIQTYDGQIVAINRVSPLLQRRVDSGASSPAEVTRAQLAVDLLRAEQERAKSELSIARRELAILMGQNEPNFPKVAGNLRNVGNVPPFKKILADLDTNPQLMRWMSIYAQRRAEFYAARLKAMPDLQVGVGYRRFEDTGDNAVRLGVSASVPIFDQNQGGILEAEQSLKKTQAEQAINYAELNLTLGRAYDTLNGALREISLLNGNAVPNARKTVEAIEGGYEQGRFTLIELLDARSAYTQAQLRLQEALVNFHTALATLEGLTGNSIRLSKRTEK